MLKLSVVIVLVATNLVVGAKLKNPQEPSFPDGRIINGNNAQRGEAPYIVSLRSSTSHFCAGSIIDPHWVLTAAHCLTNPLNIILAGLHNRSDESQVQVRYVTKALTIQHELYEGNVGPNDIGLIYISQPFNVTVLQRDGTPVVSKIALPSGKHELTGEGQLFGWGIDNSGWLSNTLQTLNVNIINYTDCKQKLPQDAPVAPVNICTANENPVDGACNGDSGGPLVRNTADGPELVGIVSWGYTPCIITDYPSVYTSTASYIDWIERQIAEFVNPFA